MIPILSLLALAVTQLGSDIPTLDGEKPHFGFACHPSAAGASGGNFRYYVFMPENKPLGMPQLAKVKVVDGSPTSLPQHDFVVSGDITHINMLAPPGAATQTSPDQPPPYFVFLNARSGQTDPIQAKLFMSIVAVFERQPDGQFQARLKPSTGSLDLSEASAAKTQSVKVECDDLFGRGTAKH